MVFLVPVQNQTTLSFVEISAGDLDPQDPNFFRPPGSGSGPISRQYGASDSNTHQNVTEPQHRSKYLLFYPSAKS